MEQSISMIVHITFYIVITHHMSLDDSFLIWNAKLPSNTDLQIF